MARVLVTGGAGFIGSHLVDALVARGEEVRVFDNFSSGSHANLTESAEKVEIIEGDLRQPAEISAAVDGIDFIFHQAAFVSVPESLEKPSACYASNVQGTIDLLEAARQASVEGVVLASSAAVYGEPQKMPLSEDDVPQCLSPYASSKVFNENLAQLYTSAFDLPVTALRYFNVYGPRQSPDSDYAAVVPRFIQRMRHGQAPRIFGDGRQSRDFIYVGDVVRANLLARTTEDAVGKAFNVCSGRETTLLEMVDVLARLFPDAPPAEFTDPRPGDVMRSLGDPDTAARHLGFRAQIKLHDGLQRTAEGYNS